MPLDKDAKPLSVKPFNTDFTIKSFLIRTAPEKSDLLPNRLYRIKNDEPWIGEKVLAPLAMEKTRPKTTFPYLKWQRT